MTKSETHETLPRVMAGIGIPPIGKDMKTTTAMTGAPYIDRQNIKQHQPIKARLAALERDLSKLEESGSNSAD